MGLFSALLLDSNKSEKQNTDIPTVVQLFTGYSFPLSIDTSGKSNPRSPFLHYSAIRTISNAESDYLTPTSPKGLRKQKKETLIPDLGVWSCNCSHKSLVDAIMPKTTDTFCMVVDLTMHLEDVEPSIALQQSALVRHLIQHPKESTSGTTSLYDLKVAQFGRAIEDKKSDTPKTEKTDEKCCINLIISVNTDDTSDDPKELQYVSFLTYHLRKYAAALHASLVFVKDQPGFVTIPQLPIVWKEFSLGKPVWEHSSIDSLLGETTPEASDDANHEHSLIYGPTADTELIEGVLLRNATYPGNWDATKDSVWKVLPPKSKEASKSNSIEAGDQGWLTELRDSMASITAMQTPQKQPTTASASSAAKTPNDPAVSDFFNDLLKK